MIKPAARASDASSSFGAVVFWLVIKRIGVAPKYRVYFGAVRVELAKERLTVIVRYEGLSNPIALLDGKEYKVESVECGWYRIIDESGEDYLYPARCFSVVQHEPVPPIIEPEKM